MPPPRARHVQSKGGTWEADEQNLRLMGANEWTPLEHVNVFRARGDGEMILSCSSGSVVIPRFPLAATSFANHGERDAAAWRGGGAPAHRRPCHTRPKLPPVRCTAQLGEGS